MSAPAPGRESGRVRSFAILAVAAGLVAAGSAVYAATREPGPQSIPASGGLTGEPLAIVVGDESGAAAGDGTSWTEQLAELYGWQLIDFTEPGSGYATIPTTECAFVACTAVFQVLPQVVALNPDVVIISAGLHDIRTEAVGLTGVVEATLAQLRTSLPGVPIVVVTPFSPVVDEQTSLAELDAQLVDSGQRVTVTVLPGVQDQLLARPCSLDEDGLTAAGDDFLRELVVSELRLRGLIP